MVEALIQHYENRQQWKNCSVLETGLHLESDFHSLMGQYFKKLVKGDYWLANLEPEKERSSTTCDTDLMLERF